MDCISAPAGVRREKTASDVGAASGMLSEEVFQKWRENVVSDGLEGEVPSVDGAIASAMDEALTIR